MLNEGPRRIAVPLGSRSYDVLIGDGLIEVAGRELRAVSLARRAMVVSDATVAPLYLDALRRSLEGEGFATSTHIVAPGEGSKSFATLAEVVDAILAAGLERGDVVVALGGGVVGDLSGFAAAIARRGTAFAQVPTSLLAQVDSAVGGKTGINTVRGKNLVGAFHQPILVLADTLALATLSERERRAGYAEIAKIGLIGDANFFARLEALGPRAPHEDVVGSIATAVAAKAAIVTEDEREAGRRALLNLGHTFAHAVERCAGYDGTIVHGEAVGLGLCLAFRLSVALDLCPAAGGAARCTTHRCGGPSDDVRRDHEAALPRRPRRCDGAGQEGEGWRGPLRARTRDRRGVRLGGRVRRSAIAVSRQGGTTRMTKGQ